MDYFPSPECNLKACRFDINDQDDQNDKPKTKIIYKNSNVIKPTSCEDLKSMGHSLSGFYLIKANDQNEASLTNKLLTVFCDFSLKKLKSSMKLNGN